LFLQAVRFAFSLLPAKTGRSNDARIAMIAIETINSINVKARKKYCVDFTFCNLSRI
jgi:hypothetical protein